MNDGRFETILKTILNGDLSKKEIERRLQEVIDEELSGPLDAPADMELVEKCQSLLWALKTNGQIPYPDGAEESKKRLLKKLERNSAQRKRSFFMRLAVIAATLLVFLGLGLVGLRWFDGESTPDGQQYVIRGKEITTEMVVQAIAEHQGDGKLVTTSKEEAEGYLGFEIPLPEQLLGEYSCEKYSVHMLPAWAQCMCNYANDEQQINVAVYFLTDVNNSVLFFEQDNEGKRLTVNGRVIYLASNVNQNTFTWAEDNVIYSIGSTLTMNDNVAIIEKIME